MSPIKKVLFENITEEAISSKVVLSKTLQSMIADDKLKELNTIINQINRLKKQGSNDTSAKSEISSSQEDNDITSRLKKEAIAYYNSPTRKLDENEKQKRIEIIQNSAKLTIKRKTGTCFIYIDGLEEPAKFNIKAQGNGWYSGGNLTTPSTYGNLIQDDLKELLSIGENSRKSFKTKAAIRQVASQKKEKEAQKRQISRQQEILKLQQEALKCFREMIGNISGENLFNAFALDNQQGKDILKLIAPDKDNGSLQDTLRQDALEAVIWDKNVWSLYQKKDNRCYYDNLASSIYREENFDKEVRDYFNREDVSAEKSKQLIMKLAGTTLPFEVAQDLFLKTVFEQGMSLTYKSKFTEDKFNKMNKIMEPFGYRISWQSFTAQRECSEGAQAVSKVVLDKTPKDERYQEIALLYNLGKMFNNAKKIDDTDIMREQYAMFVQLYYGVPAEKAHHDKNYTVSWSNFVKNKDNIKIALDVYNEINSGCRNQEEAEKLISSMSRKFFASSNSLVEESIHHGFERKYAGVIESATDIVSKRQNSILNEHSRLTETITWHPADNDPHRTLHKFDTCEVYHFVRDDQWHTGPITSIKKGDKVKVPVLEIKGADGKFHRALESETLLITSQGATIALPTVPGRVRNNGLSKIIENNR